jgi:hypothetical protein
MTLTMTIEREVKPEEIVNLVWGTGALSYSWWRGASLQRYSETRRRWLPVTNADEAQEGDAFVFTVDDPEEDEGSGRTKKIRRTMRQIIQAAAEEIKAKRVYDSDAIGEDLGYCDAPQADCVLQRACFGGDPIYG